jgi:hypothetical protein
MGQDRYGILQPDHGSNRFDGRFTESPVPSDNIDAVDGNKLDRSRLGRRWCFDIFRIYQRTSTITPWKGRRYYDVPFCAVHCHTPSGFLAARQRSHCSIARSLK